MSTVVIHGDLSAGSIAENGFDVISRDELQDALAQIGQPIPLSVTSATVSRTIETYETIILANGGVTLTLPDATAVPNKLYVVKMITNGFVNVDPIVGQAIDGHNRVTINDKNASITIISNAENWWII